MSEIELKPCPFCGAPAKIRSCRAGEDSTDTWVECTDCGVSTDRVDAPYEKPEIAASIWNQRTDLSGRGTDVISLLESLLWSKRLGNGIAIYPSLRMDNQRCYAIQDLGDQDASDLGMELTKSHTSLAAALEELLATQEAKP